MPGTINKYLNSLARRLHLDPQREREILEELQGHIEDKAAEMEAAISRRTILTLLTPTMAEDRISQYPLTH